MLLFVLIGAAALVLVVAATRPTSFALGLIQIFSFLALVFGLVGWFAILPDPAFLWYIAVGGAAWLMTTVLRHRIAA